MTDDHQLSLSAASQRVRQMLASIFAMRDHHGGTDRLQEEIEHRSRSLPLAERVCADTRNRMDVRLQATHGTTRISDPLNDSTSVTDRCSSGSSWPQRLSGASSR